MDSSPETGRRFFHLARAREHSERISGDLAEPVRWPAEAVGAARGTDQLHPIVKRATCIRRITVHFPRASARRSHFRRAEMSCWWTSESADSPKTRPHRPNPRSRGPLRSGVWTDIARAISEKSAAPSTKLPLAPLRSLRRRIRNNRSQDDELPYAVTSRSARSREGRQATCHTRHPCP